MAAVTASQLGTPPTEAPHRVFLLPLPTALCGQANFPQRGHVTIMRDSLQRGNERTILTSGVFSERCFMTHYGTFI